jgi:VCBS repeat-containing protein
MSVFNRSNYSYLFFEYPLGVESDSYDVSNGLTSAASLSGEVTYSATLMGGLALPEWLSFDPVTHIFSGTPTVSDLGAQDIKVLASDGTSQLEVGFFATLVGDSFIKASDFELLHDVTLSYFKNDVDTGVSTAVSDGAFTIDTSVEFDAIKLSSTAYNDDINITDAIDILRHIVDLEIITAGTATYHAADVDNDGNINISDAIDVLRHIVDLESIDTFDLLDSDGNRITELDSTTPPAPSWTIIANGDVDQSGNFIDDFVSTVVTTWVNNVPTLSVTSLTAVDENDAQAVAASVSASDIEDGSLTVTLSGNGADDSKFEIVSGDLRLKDAADYEAQSSYNLQLSVTDVYGDTVLKNIEVSVNDINDAAVITAADGTIAEGTATLSATATHTDADTGSTDNTFLAVSSVASTYGTYSVTAAGVWTYTLNSAHATIDALGDGDNKTDTITVTAEDGTTEDVTITITGINDIPTLSVTSLTAVDENDAQAVAASVSSSDIEDGSLTVTLSGNGADDDKFEIVNGNLRIKTSADYETQSSYRLQLSVTDSDGVTVLKNIEVSVNNLAEDISGSVVDGYVAGATIFQDLDNDNVLDAGEPSTTTSSTGEFTLSNIVASSSAPLKIISGFDIATNKAIVTSLGTPSNSAAQVLVSPVSTVASLAYIKDNTLNFAELNTYVSSATSLERVATYFDVSSTSQSNLNILSVDPLDKLRDSDSTIVTAAKDVFEANQLVMALTHSVEAVGAYLANAIDAAVHTELDSQSITGYEALASGGIDEYKKIAADALMEGAASHIVPSQTLSSTNAFQISNTQVILRDFDPDTGLNIENRIPLVSADSALTLDTDNAFLNLQNLNNLGDDSGEFTTPTLSFELAKLPIGSGSSSFVFNLIEGENGYRNNGEKQFQMNFNVGWTSDGTTAQITAPPQTVTGYYYTPGGTRIDFEIDNYDSDIISVTQSKDGTYPVSLNINLGGVTHGYEFGLTSTSTAQAGAIYIDLSTTLPLVDETGATITSINSVLRIADDSALTVFVADAEVHEGDATPTAVVYLNHVHSEDVTLSYTLSSIGADSATADVDYSASTGTVTILAGYTSATIALPILTDTSLESSETLTLTANSVSAGTLVNSTASITIHDSTKTITSSGELSSLSADVVDSINSSITTSLEDAYNTAATNASKTWALDSTVFTTAANNLVPGLKTIVDVFYGIIKTEIDSAAATSDVSAFATSLMVANAATKLFDPTSIIGTNINGDGSYPTGQSLATLTSAIEAEYTTFKSLTNDTIGDIFGDDTATYFASATVAMLTDGNDTETLSSASEIIATFDGVDTVYGGAGNDKMIGGKDVDTLYGGDGIDHIYGFTGNDVLDGGAGDDKIVGGLGDDTITAGAGDDYIMAQTGDDTITTGSGSDTVLGGLGNDSITVDGTGNKTINGGSGTDTLVMNYASYTLADFSISYNSSTNTVSFTDPNGGVVAASNFELFTFGGVSYHFIYDGYDYNSQTQINNGASSDISNGANNRISHAFISNDGTKAFLYSPSDSSYTNYTIPSATSFGTPSSLNGVAITITGSSVNDMISDRGDGGMGALTINAGAGDDQVAIGGNTNDTDTVNLGSGDDIVYVGSDYATDNLDGGTGTDWIGFSWSYGSSNLTYTINSGNASNFENIAGGQGNDTLTGDANANVILGGKGNDTIYGKAGNDKLYGGISPDSSGNNLTNSLNLTVGLYYNQYYQGAGNDSLYGGAGDDELYGSAQDDLLDGGTGKDSLSGGDGSDTFIIRSGDGSSVIANADTVTDFTDGTDVIGLDDGLLFSDLSVEQGTGDYSNDTLVSITITATREYLAIVEGINATALTEVDFTPVDIL